MSIARYVVAFFFVTIFLQGFSQSQQYRFARLDVNDGLSHNMVNDFVKDSAGFMWIATLSGLNRFDGHSIKTYRNIPGDTTSLLLNDVTKVFDGPKGAIWMYTNAGNCVYDPRTEIFYRNTNAILRRMGVWEGLITFLKKDSRGNYWFIHYNQGLFKYDPKLGKSVRLFPAAGDTTSISTSELSVVTEDPSGNIWLLHKNGLLEKIDPSTLKVTFRNNRLTRIFGKELLELDVTADADGDLWVYSNSNHGCFYFSPSTDEIRRFNTTSEPKITSNLVRKIVQDNKGIIWVATDHGGINLIDKKNDFRVRHLKNDNDDDKTISQNSLNTLYKDNEGIIWAGTYKKGVSYYHENIFRFELFRHYNNRPGSLPFSDVNALAEDAKGNLWIGTNGGGLIYFDREKNTFKSYKHEADNRNSLSSNVIVSLLIDHKQTLWIGTYYGGLNSFDGKTFRHFAHDPADSKSIGDDSIWEILEDSNHNLWIGTLRGGVDVYKRDKDEFFHYKNGDLNSIHTTYVPSLREDSEGNIWIGTGYGIDVLEKHSGRFVHYLNDVDDPGSISNNSILSTLEDSRGLIWVATHGGLNLYDKKTRNFRAFQEREGLPHNSVLTLVEDNDHHLWMSTPNGISRLTVNTDATGGYQFNFRNYNESDGLQGRAFNENAVLKCWSGEIVFGGPSGINIFRPENIGVNTVKPKVILTDLQVFNKSVKIGEPNSVGSLRESITAVDEITLDYADNVFSIEFAALNFFHPEKSQYQYKLDGFSKDWLTTDSKQRKVTFTNLDPGEYAFKVKASNNDGVWNHNPTVVRITILPPLWRSNAAFVAYGLLIIGGLLLGRWLILTKERMNFRIERERHEAHRMHELDMMKIKFFTNISHEFRTPLSLIITPAERLLEQTSDDEHRKQYQLIHRNARRLLNLVNQLLDFRKMEVQEVKLIPSEGDIVRFIRELVNSFSDISEKKDISLSFSSTVDAFETLFDQDKVEKIIFNLLSNAFKFTNEHGKVDVALGLENHGALANLRIEVRDTGIGVPKELQENVFERFFQHDTPKSIMNQGSGIGLSITREFVKVHGGTISLESEPGKGSSFVVNLPLPRLSPAPGIAPEVFQEVPSPSTVEEHSPGTGPGHDNKKPVVLLVEDNEDFRFYLKDNLRLHYAVIESSNGKHGLQRALATLPDLIVSDIMMPEMNGIELCRKIRQDPNTSHIPVILLTARTSDEQKLEGFETGASDYITKPFNFELLQSRIRNLLQQRTRTQQAFQKHFDVKASDIQITSMDEKLIQKAIRIVEEHIGDPDFSVEELSREMAMSRVHLYKKLLSLTGKSPIEFIRTIRLQRAAQLLQKSQLTVAEVAYQVGFNNPKYFSKYFKDEFNILPSMYAGGKS